ncbi:MAG: hypothetical protein N4A45_11405 [Flavobacteriales bacterium]|jgi:hypothetical protein|nr:hypothetical protein [Flavobacteriales bacterium]
MIKKILLVLAVIFGLNPLFAQNESQEFLVDTKKSSTFWSATKGKKKVHGEIAIKDGSILSLKDEKIQRAHIIIDVTKLTISNLKGEELDAYNAFVHSNFFLFTEKFSEIQVFVEKSTPKTEDLIAIIAFQGAKAQYPLKIKNKKVKDENYWVLDFKIKHPFLKDDLAPEIKEIMLDEDLLFTLKIFPKKQ